MFIELIAEVMDLNGIELKCSFLSILVLLDLNLLMYSSVEEVKWSF